MNNGKTRRKVPGDIFENISPNKNAPRNRAIRRLTPHCVAGNLTIEATLNLAAFRAGGKASTSYAIGSDGRIGLGVEETSRPWTSSSAANDNEAITFEIANNGGAPDWRMSNAAINTWLDTAVDICRFYGFSKVAYRPKPATVTSSQVETWINTWAKDDEMLITLHNWYANKACPGPYLMRQLPWLVREMNKRLQDSAYVPEAFVGEGVGPPAQQTVIPPQSGVPAPQQSSKVPEASTNTSQTIPISGGPIAEYQITITTPALNIRKGPGTNHPVVRTLMNDRNIYTIVEEAAGPGANKWGRLKSGAGWISLDFTQRR